MEPKYKKGDIVRITETSTDKFSGERFDTSWLQEIAEVSLCAGCQTEYQDIDGDFHLESELTLVCRAENREDNEEAPQS